MAKPWKKHGWYYAPRWTNPLNGQKHGRFPLATQDPARAEAKWIAFQAGEIAKAGGAAEPPAPGEQADLPLVGRSAGNMMLSQAIDDYFAVRLKSIRPRTRSAYADYRDLLLRRLPDRLVSALAPPDGTRALSDAYEMAIGQGVRKHTLWKWFVAILRPALRHAREMRWLHEMPEFPKFTSDYKSKGRKDKVLTPAEVAALHAAMPEVARILGTTVYPRLITLVGACTGMHTVDLMKFRGDYWRRLGRQWFRVNTKRAEIYEPEWFAIEPEMQAALEAAYVAREWSGDDGILCAGWQRIAADGDLEQAWVNALKLIFVRASKRAGLPMKVTPIWLRHYVAAQCRDNGWPYEDTAKLLGNSEGIVRQVYAHVPVKRISDRVRDQGLSADLAKALAEAPAVRADVTAPIRARAVEVVGKEATGTDERPATVLQFPRTVRAKAKGGQRNRPTVEVEREPVLRKFSFPVASLHAALVAAGRKTLVTARVTRENAA